MMKPTRHPSTARLFREAAARFMDAKHRHRQASDWLWAGMLASTFTPNELQLLKDYLSPHDMALLSAVRKAGRG